MNSTSSSFGPTLTESDFQKLISEGEKMAALAGTDKGGQKFPADPSYIPIEAKPPAKGSCILAVDVGGTHIKIGVRRVNDDGTTSWMEILDIDNDVLNTGKGDGKGLQRMATELCRHIVKSLDKANARKQDISAVGVVWSNQLINSPLQNEGSATRGVTGIVSGSQNGTAYRKGEWWNKDINDGDNVGEIFIQAFRAAGFSPKSFVIGNDTIYTAKAIDNADSGMVASTGANATIVPVGQHMLCNSESGGNFNIPCSMIGLPPINGRDYVKLEDVMAGKNLPYLFAEYILLAAQNGADELTRLSASIIEKRKSGKEHFAAPDISLILQGKLTEFLKGRDSTCYPEQALVVMKTIAEKQIDMAGKFAAAMAWFSFYNQIPEKDHFLVALDSSQARFQRGYFDSMKKTLSTLATNKGKTVEIRLLEPIGDISVPMIGVARAANDFLK